jgi:hypothetical protein
VAQDARRSGWRGEPALARRASAHGGGEPALARRASAHGGGEPALARRASAHGGGEPFDGDRRDRQAEGCDVMGQVDAWIFDRRALLFRRS